jgi:hypothetical protein
LIYTTNEEHSLTVGIKDLEVYCGLSSYRKAAKDGKFDQKVSVVKDLRSDIQQA